MYSGTPIKGSDPRWWYWGIRTYCWYLSRGYSSPIHLRNSSRLCSSQGNLRKGVRAGFMLNPRLLSRNPEKSHHRLGLSRWCCTNVLECWSGTTAVVQDWEREQTWRATSEWDEDEDDYLQPCLQRCSCSILTNGGIALEQVEDFNILVHRLTLSNKTSKHVRHLPRKRWIAWRWFENPEYTMKWR